MRSSARETPRCVPTPRPFGSKRPARNWPGQPRELRPGPLCAHSAVLERRRWPTQGQADAPVGHGRRGQNAVHRDISARAVSAAGRGELCGAHAPDCRGGPACGRTAASYSVGSLFPDQIVVLGPAYVYVNYADPGCRWPTPCSRPCAISQATPAVCPKLSCWKTMGSLSSASLPRTW